jgi:hypothetical protein
LFYTALLLVVSIIFAFLATRYQYKEDRENDAGLTSRKSVALGEERASKLRKSVRDTQSEVMAGQAAASESYR